MIRFRVWCDAFESWFEKRATEARSASDAAHDHMMNIDSSGDAFPDDSDGDECVISVCEWEDLDEDVDEPEAETFTFKLVKERRVVLK
jgi:hypothetical protein